MQQQYARRVDLEQFTIYKSSSVKVSTIGVRTKLFIIDTEVLVRKTFPVHGDWFLPYDAILISSDMTLNVTKMFTDNFKSPLRVVAWVDNHEAGLIDPFHNVRNETRERLLGLDNENI